jgi:hypothetical protein
VANEPFYWTAWIGPRWTPGSDSHHFPWEAYVEGAAFVARADTTLANTLAAGATSATLATATSLWAKGGCWVGPNGGGEGWEYVEWSGLAGAVLSGLTREDVATGEHNGNHTAGAAVRYWWPLTNSNDGRLHLQYALNEELSASDWQIELSGVNVPRYALRNRHLVIIATKPTLAAAWSVYAVGWLDNPQAVDDENHFGVWKANVISIGGVLGHVQGVGVRVGPLDLAKAGKAEASSTLKSAWKESLSGDYNSLGARFEAQNVCDGDPTTLWIAEQVVGPAPNFGQYPAGVHVISMQLNWLPTYEKGYRYIHIVGAARYGAILCNAYGNTVQLPEDSFNGTAVICESKAKLLEMYPQIGDTDVSYCEIGPDWFDALNLTEDAINLNSEGWLIGTIWWGPVGSTNQLQPWYMDGGDQVWGPQMGLPCIPSWTDPNVGAKGIYVLRWRAPYGTFDDGLGWAYDSADHACYVINPEKIWDRPRLVVRLASMGIVLAEDITATVPGVGGVLALTDAGGAATGGLGAAGVVMVGAERIAYSSKVAGGLVVSQRGNGGTVARAHGAGEAVLAYDDNAFVFSDGHPLRGVGWRRYGGTMYPRKFQIYGSVLTSPRFPAWTWHVEREQDWRADWTLLEDMGTWAWDTYDSPAFSPPRRLRWLMIDFDELTTTPAGEPARPRINEICAFADESFYDANTWLAAGTSASVLLRRLLENAGVPAACINTTWVSGISVAALSTADDNAWKVIRDAAAYLGVRLKVTLGSVISVVDNSTYTTQPWVYAAVLDRANVARVENAWESGSPARQVSLSWVNGAGTVKGVVRYPSSPAEFGADVELGPYLLADAASALNVAARRYWLMRFPYQAVVQLANDNLVLRPGDVVQVNWQFVSGEQLWRRAALVTAVDNVLEDGVWTTVLTVRQLEREPFNG